MGRRAGGSSETFAPLGAAGGGHGRPRGALASTAAGGRQTGPAARVCDGRSSQALSWERARIARRRREAERSGARACEHLPSHKQAKSVRGLFSTLPPAEIDRSHGIVDDAVGVEELLVGCSGRLLFGDLLCLPPARRDDPPLDAHFDGELFLVLGPRSG